MILEYAILALDIKSITVSSYGLREGIIYDTIQETDDIREYKHLAHLRYETIYSICNLYKADLRHAEHVRNLALSIFDATQTLHYLGNSEREALEAAALLHDIGYHISHDQHHKHSYYLINNCMMPGYTNNESELIALIARYHRKSHPKKKHPEFEHVSPEKQNIVRILAGILRIAEGLDRRQTQLVESVKCKISENKIHIKIKLGDASLPADIELWGANRRKSLIEEALGVAVEIGG